MWQWNSTFNAESKRDLPANVLVTVCSCFEADLCWHPWKCMRCLTKLQVNKTLTHWLNEWVNEFSKIDNYPLDGWPTFYGRYSLSLYLLMHEAHLLMAPNTQCYSFKHLINTFLYAENKENIHCITFNMPAWCMVMVNIASLTTYTYSILTIWSLSSFY